MVVDYHGKNVVVNIDGNPGYRLVTNAVTG